MKPILILFSIFFFNPVFATQHQQVIDACRQAFMKNPNPGEFLFICENPEGLTLEVFQCAEKLIEQGEFIPVAIDRCK